MGNSDYNAGYGQCRADMMKFIKEAIAEIHQAIDTARIWADNPHETTTDLSNRISELQRIRAYVKTMKPK